MGKVRSYGVCSLCVCVCVYHQGLRAKRSGEPFFVSEKCSCRMINSQVYHLPLITVEIVLTF